MTVGRFLVGILGAALGLVILYFRVPIKDFFGRIGWAESAFGRGGTWDAWIVIGFVVSILSIMYMFGGLQDVLKDRLGPLFGL